VDRSALAAPREKLTAIRAELGQHFLERAEVIEGSLAALLARQYVLLVGPPGAASSMLADELCRRISGCNIFNGC